MAITKAESAKRYRLKHPEKWKEIQQRYRTRARARILEYHQEYNHEYYLLHQERKRMQGSKFYAKSQIAKFQKQYDAACAWFAMHPLENSGLTPIQK